MMHITPIVHARGATARLDHLFDLVRFVTHPKPLSACLDELPAFVASVFSADVCSIYILEGNDLVMRGNVGFPPDALGDVRLAVGEGVTGVAVECMRPISLTLAQSHDHYRYFAQLGEERFPIFLAVPVLGPHGPLGALVLQRRNEPAFDDAEIQLAVAITVPICAAVERARLVEALHAQHRPLPIGTRRVTLSGRAAVRGRAFGRACALRRPTPTRLGDEGRPTEDAATLLERTVLQTRRHLDLLLARSLELGLGTNPIERFSVILDDGRVRERALERCAEGRSLAQALIDVGGEAGRAAHRSGDAFSVDHAQAISDLCEALAVLVSGSDADLAPRGAVLVGDRLTVFDLLISARRQVRGLVLQDSHSSPGARALVELIGVPTVTDVHGLFRWVSDEDMVLVDADHGLVRVNPSRADIAAVREEQRRSRDDVADTNDTLA